MCLGPQLECLSFRQDEVEEAYLIYSPLALGTVEGLISGNVSAGAEYTKTKIFWQCLDGIEFIHDQGVIRGDIKPANMSVVSLNPPQARLINFGSAIHSPYSDDYNTGTDTYHAPEMWRLRKGSRLLPFGKAVDLFAFGLSAYRLFCGVAECWDLEADADVMRTVKGLLEQRTENILLMAMIQTFLAEDPQPRMTAQQAKAQPGITYAPGDRETDDNFAHDIASLRSGQYKCSVGH